MAESTVDYPPPVASGPPAQPPATTRRPRVREVSSRFMSPSVSPSPSSNGDSPRHHHHHLPTRSPLQRHNLGSTPMPNTSDQNPRPRSSSESRRRRQLDMEQTFSSSNGEIQPPQAQIQSSEVAFEQFPPSTLRKQKSAKLLKENIGNRQTPAHHGKGEKRTVSASFDRTMSVASRFRATPQQNFSGSHAMASSAAAKLLQSSVMSLPSEANSVSDADRHAQLSSSMQSLPELRDSDGLVPTFSERPKSGHMTSSRHFSTPFVSAEGERAINGALKPCLPPVPPGAASKAGRAAGKKVPSQQENAHFLRLLQNRYLQWRFANAKAEASDRALQRETETKVNSLRAKLSEMHDSVTKKRLELGILQRTKTLSAILEAQVPCLDQWSDLEEDYSVSLAESIQALLNASIQLPLGSNVKVDIKEFQESLNSATKVMESMVSHVQHLVPKAEETEVLMSELAKIVGGERGLVEECGVLLSRTHASQLDESSLRAQLIQLHTHFAN